MNKFTHEVWMEHRERFLKELIKESLTTKLIILVLHGMASWMSKLSSDVLALR